MKLLGFISVFIIPFGALLASYSVSGQLSNAKLGFTIWLNSELRPPKQVMQVADKFGILSLPNGEPGMLRFSANTRRHEVLGYEMHVVPITAMGKYRVTFVPLRKVAVDLGLDPKIAWRFIGPFELPPPQMLAKSEQVSVDLLSVPAARIKVVDLIRITQDRESL